MNRRDEARIVELLVEIGGRSAWVLLWEDRDADAHVMASVAPDDVPEVVCGHLLRMLRGELGPHGIVAMEH